MGAMTPTYKLYLSFICLITIFTRTGQPLKCWHCSSMIEPGCDDPFSPEEFSMGIEYFLFECNTRAILNGSLDQQLMDHVFGPNAKEYCRKAVHQTYGMTIVTRGCWFGDISKDCPGSKYDACKTEACFEDGCNAAPRFGFSLFIPLLMLWSFSV